MNAFQHYAIQLDRHPMRLNDSKPVSPRKPRNESENHVLAFLARGPALTIDIAEDQGKLPHAMSNVLRRMMRRGLLIQTSENLGSARTWRLA